jgi:hypothetical protein
MTLTNLFIITTQRKQENYLLGILLLKVILESEPPGSRKLVIFCKIIIKKLNLLSEVANYIGRIVQTQDSC